jgi:Protein of unknown function (DUF3987)
LREVGNGEGARPSSQLGIRSKMAALGPQEFFRTLYGDDAPGYLPIFTHSPNRTRWVAANSPAEAAKIAVENGRERDTYFGIGLHKAALRERRRGAAAEVNALPGLWADLDVKGEAHEANNLPPTGKDAMCITEAIPLKPTLIVLSGHGLQVWWLFKELWVFEGEDERKEAQELSRRFQATLKQRAKGYGWQMDGTHDISRVFRQPGTLNRKLNPVEVRVMRYDEGTRYNPAEFEQYLIDVAPEEDHEVNSEGNGHDPEASRALYELVRKRLSSRILKAFEGGPDAFEPEVGKDGSTSGADAAVCTALIGAGLTDAQIRDIYRIYPIGTRGKYAGRGDEYLARTLKNAREWFNANEEFEAAEDVWEEPVPLPEGLPPVAGLDPTMIPEPFRGWIVDVSERMQIPSDFAAAGAVVVAGSLIGRKLGIHPKRQDDWLVVPTLWGAVVGRPSVLKSPALAEVMKPLARPVAEAYEEYQEARLAYESDVMVAEATKAALKDELKKAAREAARSRERSMLTEIASRSQDAEVPEEPLLKRYKTEDATVEKISEILLENPRGILVHRDELSGWLRNLDKQGREGDRSFYLEAWNGTGSFDVDRIGRGSLHIPALCLSILGSIQPGSLSSYVYQATQGEKGDDGLLQRFQLLVWPDPLPTWRNVDRWPDVEAKNRAYEVFRRLDALNPEDFGASGEDEEGIPAVRFTEDAQEIFDQWRDELEVRLRSTELSPALESHLAEYRSLMPSLALIFQLIEFVDGSGDGGAVGIKPTLQAAAWCEHLETHARRLYSSAENPAMEGARALLERIRKGEVSDDDPTRSVYRKHWAKLSTPEEVSSACSVLEEFGWIRVEAVKTSGRSTTRLRLHPTLREQT